MAERFLNRREVGENVRVIELDIADDGALRQVMNELAALVEKRRVVFIPLDDEPLAVREPRALRQIVREAADEVTRIQPVMLEHPGQQTRGRGLAVRARDDDGAFAANEKLAQQIRQRTKPQLVVEAEFRLRIAARYGVANDHQIGSVRQIMLGETCYHRDLALGQKGGHGRIHILVGAGDGKSLFPLTSKPR